MADTKREIERKYEGPPTGGDPALPDLTRVPGVSGVVDKGVADLDATYYDTAPRPPPPPPGPRPHDAGWHLKLPVSEGVRDEIRAPLSDSVPHDLSALVRSRVREAELVPVVRLLSARDVRHLVDASGSLLAEVSVDRVRAERLSGGTGVAEWTEIEVELADDGDPAFLDKVEKKLRKAGLERSSSKSKLAKALSDTDGTDGTESTDNTNAAKAARKRVKPAPADRAPRTAGDHVLAYLRTQRDAIVELDPAVRRDLHDSVHSMRVATRRMRSAFRSYGKVLDRAGTDPIGEELKWGGGAVGGGRDADVDARPRTTARERVAVPAVTPAP
ncbi:CHAD domain-containing protein, partial [Streptomyces sp. NPDC059466]|uniref:CYTH and CHAD domain-containing protein n=1 Tax=Streptomyces sp. NPDC059466 TaxID=3346843 RepID=UPI0036AF6B69